MGQESSYMKGSGEGSHLIDIRELGSWDPVKEFQEQIDNEIDEKLGTEEKLRQHEEDRARLKKLWEEITAKNYNEKKSK